MSYELPAALPPSEEETELNYLIAYDCTLKQPGCALLQATLSVAPIPSMLFIEHFPTGCWLLVPSDDMGVYPVTSLAQLETLAQITRDRDEP